MAENKRYYWLKIEDSFFKSKEIKFLRKHKRGDSLVLIYLKMMLLSLEAGGKLYFDGIGDSLEEELAIELDEEIEDIQEVLNYLQGKKLMSTEENAEGYYLEQVPEMTGSETDSARVKRKQRGRNVDNVQELSEPVQNSPHISESDQESESDKEKESDFAKVCAFYKIKIGMLPKDKDKKLENKAKSLLTVFSVDEFCEALEVAKAKKARSKMAYAISILENQKNEPKKSSKGIPDWSSEKQGQESQPISAESFLEFVNAWFARHSEETEQQATLWEISEFLKSNLARNMGEFLRWRGLSPIERAKLEVR